MRAGALVCLTLYGAAVVVAVAAVGAGAKTDGAPHLGPVLERNPVAEEATNESLRTRMVEWRRTARRRARIISNQRLMLHRRFAYAPQHWLEQAFLCIHRGEGSWTDPRAPYWGGLQMDYGFQQTYGRPYWRVFGTADQWPASVQIAVAINAWFSRGFRPWPTTARSCGLL